MNTVWVVLVVAVVGAVICARSRAAGATLFFGALAVLLLVATPLGDGLPEGLSQLIQWGADQAPSTPGGAR